MDEPGTGTGVRFDRPVHDRWSRVQRTAYLVPQHLRYNYPGPIPELRHQLIIVPPAAGAYRDALRFRPVGSDVAGRRCDGLFRCVQPRSLSERTKFEDIRPDFAVQRDRRATLSFALRAKHSIQTSSSVDSDFSPTDC